MSGTTTVCSLAASCKAFFVASLVPSIGSDAPFIEPILSSKSGGCKYELTGSDRELLSDGSEFKVSQ